MDLQIVRVLWFWDLESVDLDLGDPVSNLFFVLQQEITARAYHSDYLCHPNIPVVPRDPPTVRRFAVTRYSSPSPADRSALFHPKIYTR
jgi:hypothetical protein